MNFEMKLMKVKPAQYITINFVVVKPKNFGIPKVVMKI